MMAVESPTTEFPCEQLNLMCSEHECGGGVTALDPYVEQFWLPIIGPTAFLVLRHAHQFLAGSAKNQHTVSVSQWANSLGVGSKGGRNGPFWRAMRRLHRFNLIQLKPDTATIYKRVPLLNETQVSRLPYTLQVQHRYWELPSSQHLN